MVGQFESRVEMSRAMVNHAEMPVQFAAFDAVIHIHTLSPLAHYSYPKLYL